MITISKYSKKLTFRSYFFGPSVRLAVAIIEEESTELVNKKGKSCDARVELKYHHLVSTVS